MLRNFDEVIQTKSNKVTVGQQIDALKEGYISESHFQSFTLDHEKV